MSNIFRELFIFEMANNHQGDLEHGFRIVDSLKKVKDKFNIKAGVKLQYRDLWPEPNFIHFNYRNRDDVKHIPRFLGTRLTDEEFVKLNHYIKDAGFYTIVTPFDEASVDKCIKHDVDIIKVASCSLTDWPLLAKISSNIKPKIVSTGGGDLSDIDNMVSYFTHRGNQFAIMHCVGVYPCKNDMLNMKWVSKLKKRYPGISVGYSGHEAPDNTDVVIVAISMGADILERHVGEETDIIKLNKYSMNSQQAEKWVKAAFTAKTIVGSVSSKPISDSEKESLLTLKRGVFANKILQKGDEINRDDVYFAMPCVSSEQLDSGEFGKKWNKFTASKAYLKDDPIFEMPHISHPEFPLTRKILHEVKGYLNESNIDVSEERDVEISHHYGVDRFYEVGAVLINIINREYAKKLIIMLPGQRHPKHHHKIKEETFQILEGSLSITTDDENKLHLRKGEKFLVKRNTWHEFETGTGVIFEEISTTAIKDDSYYEDRLICNIDPMERKTRVDKW